MLSVHFFEVNAFLLVSIFISAWDLGVARFRLIRAVPRPQSVKRAIVWLHAFFMSV